MISYAHRFSDDELAKEYSPSSCIDNIDTYLEQYKTMSAQARQQILERDGSRLNLRYASKPQNTLDLFLPAAAGQPPPLHIFIHGGYWQTLDKSDSSFLAQNFTEHGAAVAAINYTLAPEANMDQIVAEVAQALVWLFENAPIWGYNPQRIFLSGSSAGAHLAAMMLSQDWAKYGVPAQVIKGALLVSGIFDLEPIALTYVNKPLCLTREQIKQNSPVLATPTINCPIIIAYGDNETNEFKRQSNAYYKYLLGLGFHCQRREISDRNHFDIILDLTHKQSTLTQLTMAQMGLARSQFAE